MSKIFGAAVQLPPWGTGTTYVTIPLLGFNADGSPMFVQQIYGGVPPQAVTVPALVPITASSTLASLHTAAIQWAADSAATYGTTAAAVKAATVVWLDGTLSELGALL